MRKRILPMVLVVVSMLTISVCAIEPRYASAKPTLNFSGSTANCEVRVSAGGSDIDVTMELWCGSTLIESWSDEGVNSVTLQGSCRVEKGKTYTLEAYGTADGVSFTATPIRKTC